MYTIERKSEILDLLERDKKVDVSKIAARFGISKETIRRDLRDLEQEGLLTRTHGGAVLNSDTRKENSEFPLRVRGMRNSEEKNKICQRAAQLIQDGDTIFIDNSSTTLHLLKYINRNMHVTVITNSIQVLLESAQIDNSHILLISLGGIFRPSNISTYGNISIEAGKTFYPNKAFISCSGIHPTTFLTDTSVYEVETKRSMMQQSTQTYVLADHTKFTKGGTVFVSDFSPITAIITDNGADPELLQFLNAYDVDLIIAD